jgi:[acyl-carrier-protein] S-malonyltransferase
VGLGVLDLVERERLVKVAFCFPGQGSQDVGMGREIAGAFPEAQAVYEDAADAVGFDIARICFEGPMEELTRTEIQQPALVTTSLACLRAVETRGISADVVVGHSVGEYSALGAAGALPDREAVALVRERGEATAAAAAEHPGAMAAIIGLEDSVVEELCRSIENVWPANYNCPGQLVVSGERGAVDRLLEEAAARGARKTVKLRVGGAFHSPLVASAAERLRPAVEALSWKEPSPPFMSTVSAQIESADRLGELLVQQLTAPVRFTQAVATLVQEGVDMFVEIGPGQVLSGLVRRCDRSLRTISVGDPASLRKLEETLSAA